MYPVWLPYVTMAFGAVPLLCLAWLHRQGETRRAGWWVMAAGFAVSFVADASRWHGHPIVSQTYPVLQSGLLLAALLPATWHRRLVAVIVLAAVTSVVARQGSGLDVLLHVVAWGAVAVTALIRVPHSALRWTLALGFAALTLTWVAFVAARTFMDPRHWSLAASLGAMQAVRLATALGFCWAVSREGR